MRIPISRKNFFNKRIQILIAQLKNYWLRYKLQIKGFEIFGYEFNTSELNIIIKKYNNFSIKNKFT